MKRGNRERSEHETLPRFVREGIEKRGASLGAHREHHADACIGETAERESRHRGRRCVEPLDVVDRDDDLARLLPALGAVSRRRCRAVSAPVASVRRSSTAQRRAQPRCGGGSEATRSAGTDESRSDSPANESFTSDSVDEVASTQRPRACARRTYSRQTVVFPIPGSPSISSPAGYDPSAARDASIAAISTSRPTTDDDTPTASHGRPKPQSRRTRLPAAVQLSPQRTWKIARLVGRCRFV